MLSRGAALTESFTERELRSAFRLLARQYHPDRHPHASEAARARLARLFGALVADHHTLRTALRPEPTRPH